MYKCMHNKMTFPGYTVDFINIHKYAIFRFQ